MRHFSFISKTPTTSLIGDTYPPYACYSIRQLVTGATNCIRVRRASDNTEQTIGFVSGVLDTSSLATFCSGTTGYVKTWYDQSGNGYDLTQTTTSKQPRIYASGAVDTINSKPAIKFTATNTLERASLAALATGSAWSYFCVTSAASTSTVGVVFCNSATSADRVVVFCDTRTTPIRNLIVQNKSATAYPCDLSTARTTANVARYLSGFSTTGLAISGFDNGATGGTNTYTGTYTNDTFRVGAQHSDQTPLTGNIQEIFIYGSNQSSNRTAIESNIATYYSI